MNIIWHVCWFSVLGPLHGLPAFELIPGGPYITKSGPKEGVLNVHLLCHTHDDVGWLKTVEEYYLGSRGDIQMASVQYILDSVLSGLLENPDRKFTYVEMAFFSRWWRRLGETKQSQVRKLLDTGQLEFANGGWSSNDEATPTFVDIIDQHTMGGSYIAREFGTKQCPDVGWQMDPFGHSWFQSYAYDKMGMNSWFFSRADYGDFANRKSTKTMETIHSNILAGLFQHYDPPKGFNFNINTHDTPLNDDIYVGEPNIEEKVNDFVNQAMEKDLIYNLDQESTRHVVFTMGSDFEYGYADAWFKNLDKLIHYTNANGRVNVFYSTPQIYMRSRFNQRCAVSAVYKWTERSDYDWFPYCSNNPHEFWTGYFTSRPLLKKTVREASSMLELCRIAEVYASSPSEWLKTEERDRPAWVLWEALSVAQHHDGVSGTSTGRVAEDYIRMLNVGVENCWEFIKAKLLSHSGSSGVQNYYHSFISTNDQKVNHQWNPHSPNNPDDGKVSVSFGYYRGKNGSGAYMFRPECQEGNVAACRPTIVDQKSVKWLKYKIFSDRVEWEVGPLPHPDDDLGYEVVLILKIDGITNRGVFHTDSNGYKWMKREVNKRTTWNLQITDPVSGNLYPVTAGIAVCGGATSGGCLIATPDRSVGATSLADGEIQLMIHRRLFRDDGKGINEALNEIDAKTGDGIIVRGTTYFQITQSLPSTPNRDYLKPPIALPNGADGLKWYPLKRSLPENLSLTHFHRIDVKEFCELSEKQDCWLVRVVSSPQHGGVGSIDLNEYLNSPFGKISAVLEVTLNAGKTLEQARKGKLMWTESTKKTEPSVIPGSTTIKLVHANDIRTYIVAVPLHGSSGSSLLEISLHQG